MFTRRADICVIVMTSMWRAWRWLGGFGVNVPLCTLWLAGSGNSLAHML